MVEHCLEICGRRNTAYVHDIGTAFHFIAAAEIDTIICSLVLHYIAEWPPVLQEFRRILKPGGRCIISTHHPVNDYIYFNKENYFSKQLIEDEWQGFSPPLHVKYWVRPLQEYIQPLLESGLSLLTLAEPGPSDELKEKDEQRYERLMTQPAFLFFVLQKRE
jgi:SAM-dependent methyltransferase